MTEPLPYGRQAVAAADIEAVGEALRSPLITQGGRVDSFERAFAEYVHARHAVAFSSGTAALHAAAAAAGLRPGGELLTTPVSFVASANCALFVGARPLFCDIEDDSANLDIALALRLGLLERSTACVAVSLAGLPVDLEGLQEARRGGLMVIEDACHALGGLRGGEPVGGGARADMTVFSFHPVKAITTGEGGMVSTEDDRLAERLRAFRSHGIRRREDPHDPLLGGWHYEIDSLGFNYRITDFQCALGERQLARLDQAIAARNGIAARYRELLCDCEQVRLPASAEGDGERHAYHLFVVRFPEGAARRRAVYERLRERGIASQLHYIPIPVHRLYRSLGYTMRGLPRAQDYYEQALSLPIFPAMREQDVQRVARELRSALRLPLAPGSATASTAPRDVAASTAPGGANSSTAVHGATASTTPRSVAASTAPGGANPFTAPGGATASTDRRTGARALPGQTGQRRPVGAPTPSRRNAS